MTLLLQDVRHGLPSPASSSGVLALSVLCLGLAAADPIRSLHE